MLRSWQARRRLAPLCALMVLGGCAEAQLVAHTAKEIRHAAEGDEATPAARYKVGKPYEVAGVWYYPKVDYDYSQRGIASWYGPGFDGRRTANGEVYDKDRLTAAHRTLPLPSMVRVTNLENGRRIEVRVNDRGPFAPGRIIDVSERAAELLGFKAAGTAKVQVEVMEAQSRRLAAAALGGAAAGTAPEAAPTTEVTTASLGNSRASQQTRVDAAPEGSEIFGAQPAAVSEPEPAREPEPDGDVTYTAAEVDDSAIYVQAGSFLRYDNANRLRARLSSLGPARIEPAEVEQRQYFRVRLGPLDDVAAADRLLARLIDNGYTRARVVVD